MYPTLWIDLNGTRVALASYTVALVVAVCVAGAIGWVRGRRAGFPARGLAVCIATVSVAGLAGARLFFALLHPALFARQPGLLASVAPGHSAVLGGFVAALLAGAACCALHGLDPRRLADALAPGLGLGIAVARIGCFLAGCCFGRTTNLPWGVTYPPGSDAHLYQIATNWLVLPGPPQPVHPCQLYEAAAAMLGALLAAVVSRSGWRSGSGFLAFSAWYWGFRVANEAVRAPSPGTVLPEWGVVTLYALSAAVAAALLASSRPYLAPLRLGSGIATSEGGEL